MTHSFNQSLFANALADQMVKERFGTTHGTHDLTSYFRFVDARQTAHLATEHVGPASTQRSNIKIALENAGTIIAKVPMNDPRRRGATLWAEIELGALFDLIENGADGAWCVNYANSKAKKGYVKTSPPLSKQSSATCVTVGRLVAGAGKGRSVRFLDRNPMNLRRNNLFLIGNPETIEGPLKHCKHDALALIRERRLIRANLAGSNYAMPDKGEK